MGLYDGQIGGDGFASTAHVAAVTQTPVVLVVDISPRLALDRRDRPRHGDLVDPSVDVVGVILNKAGSPRHADEVVRLDRHRLPVLGVARSATTGSSAPSRHLGLVPAAERDDAAAALDRLAEPDRGGRRPRAPCSTLASHRAGARRRQPWDPARGGLDGARPSAGDVAVVAVAGGRAFTFRYAETDGAARGRRLPRSSTFDPLTDTSLPTGTPGLYLGGGFPEMHAAALGATSRSAPTSAPRSAAGVPTVAECAGLLYLCRSVDGAVRWSARSTPRPQMTPRLTLAYRTPPPRPTRCSPGPASRSPATSSTAPTVDAGREGDPGLVLDDPPVGLRDPTLHASYLHTHWAGHPQLAQRFAEAGATPARAGRSSRSRHHGRPSTAHGRRGLARPRGQRLRRTAAPLARPGAAREPRPPSAPTRTRPRPRPPWPRATAGDAAEVLATAGAAEAFTLSPGCGRGGARSSCIPSSPSREVALAHGRAHVPAGRPAARGRFRARPDARPRRRRPRRGRQPDQPHRRAATRPPTIRRLAREGRLVVVDEAFMDDVPGETLADERHDGLVVLRSLTKLWSIPGIRAGYLLAEPQIVDELRQGQTPWSVSAPAIAALVATSTETAREEAGRGPRSSPAGASTSPPDWPSSASSTVPSTAPFVLARTGPASREALRSAGFAVRRADTFPGLDDSWVRISARRTTVTDDLLSALRSIHPVLRKPVGFRHSGATVTPL